MMSRKPYPFVPGVMTWAEAADYACRRSESWLRSHINELDGFPRPDPFLNVFATEAVQFWVRQRFGLIRPDDSLEDARSIVMSRLKNVQPQQNTVAQKKARRIRAGQV